MTSTVMKDNERRNNMSHYEGITTTEQNDQIYLKNMDLSKLNSFKEDLMISGKMSYLNLIDSDSIQSFQSSKSFAFNHEINYVEINLSQSENDFETQRNMDKVEENNLYTNNSNNNLTPISTICNYYLKSELSGSKAKSYLIGNLKISKPNAEIEILFNKKVINDSSSSKQQNKIVNIKTQKIPGLALTERKDNNKKIKKKNNQDHGCRSQRTIQHKINIKCKRKSTSVKKTSSYNDKTMNRITDTVQKIFDCLKKNQEDNHDKSIKKKHNSNKKESCLNEQRPRSNVSHQNDKTVTYKKPIEKKMNVTSQAPFYKINKEKKNNNLIPSVRINKRKEIRPSNSFKSKELNSNNNNSAFTRNMIIFEVTENEGETLVPKVNEDKNNKSNLNKNKNHSQQNRPNNINNYIKNNLSGKKSSFIKKSFCDSNMNTTATNKNISNVSNISKGNLNQTSINQYNPTNKIHCVSKRPISLKKEFNTLKPRVEEIIEQTENKHVNKIDYISQANIIKSARRHLNEAVLLPIHSNNNMNNSKLKTGRSLKNSGLLSSTKRKIMSARRLGNYGTNTENTEQCDITCYSNSSRKNSKKHQYNSSSIINKKTNILKSTDNTSEPNESKRDTNQGKPNTYR